MFDDLRFASWLRLLERLKAVRPDKYRTLLAQLEAFVEAEEDLARARMDVEIGVTSVASS